MDFVLEFRARLQRDLQQRIGDAAPIVSDAAMRYGLDKLSGEAVQSVTWEAELTTADGKRRVEASGANTDKAYRELLARILQLD